MTRAVELALESGAEHARRVLDSYVRLKDIIDERVPTSVRYRLSIRQGDPAAEIVRKANEEGADMIVLGSQGRRRLRRLVSSSVADRVIRQVTCPVLTIEATRHQQSESRGDQK